MLGDREAMSEQSSSVHEGAGYDKVYPLGCEPEQDVTWSLEREPSIHSSIEEEEECEEDEEGEEEGDEEEEGEEKGEGEEDEKEDDNKGGDKEMVGQVDGDGLRPFLLFNNVPKRLQQTP